MIVFISLNFMYACCFTYVMVQQMLRKQSVHQLANRLYNIFRNIIADNALNLVI